MEQRDSEVSAVGLAALAPGLRAQTGNAVTDFGVAGFARIQGTLGLMT